MMNFIYLTYRNAVLNGTISNLFHQHQSRLFKISSTLLSSQGRSKTKFKGSELLRLYDQNGKVMGTKTKQEAENIAHKNGFTLVPMEMSGKPKFPEYQLRPRQLEAIGNVDDELDEGGNQDKHETSNEPRAVKPSLGEKKTAKNVDIKRIMFETSIASADLKVKVDQINNWITKDKEVHLTVVGSGTSSIDDFYEQLSEILAKEVRILVKKQKGRNLKLIMNKKASKDGSTSAVTQQQDEKKETNQANQTDEFVIDPDLLSNEAELEKVLKKIKKSK